MTAPRPIDQSYREHWVKERYRPSQEPLVRVRAKEDRITGSIRLEYSQGTIVAVTVECKVPE